LKDSDAKVTVPSSPENLLPIVLAIFLRLLIEHRAAPASAGIPNDSRARALGEGLHGCKAILGRPREGCWLWQAIQERLHGWLMWA
jgi:hypothetical protein